jgi:hypothetical protein
MYIHTCEPITVNFFLYLELFTHAPWHLFIHSPSSANLKTIFSFQFVPSKWFPLVRKLLKALGAHKSAVYMFSSPIANSPCLPTVSGKHINSGCFQPGSQLRSHVHERLIWGMGKKCSPKHIDIRSGYTLGVRDRARERAAVLNCAQ